MKLADPASEDARKHRDALRAARYLHYRTHLQPRVERAFERVEAGRLGFDRTEFEPVLWSDIELRPKIYDRDGYEVVLPGPYQANEIMRNNRMRLVELLMFQGERSRRLLSLAYGWQGDHGFHLFTGFMVLEDTTLAFREDLQLDEHLYVDIVRKTREHDWFLDVELSV